MKIVEAVVSKY